MATPETRRQLLAAVAACDDKKGEDTRILELDPADSGLADFFLITSATNNRQVVTISDEIEMRLKKDFGVYATSVEGRAQAEWILLDYVDIVIHVFLQEKREFYDIERLRKSALSKTAEDVEADLKAALADLKAALTEKTRAVRKALPAKKAVAKRTAKTNKVEGESTVSAKPAKKAVAKKAALKPVKPAAAKKSVAKKAVAVKAPKKAAVKQPVAVKSAAPPIVKATAPVAVKAAAPPIVKAKSPVLVKAAAPPILKAAAPDATSAPAKKSAKKK